MPTSKSSLINLSQYSKQQFENLCSRSLSLKLKNNKLESSENFTNKFVAALLFFEPSTRTRFSFEAACARSGVHPMVLTGAAGSSAEKGETLLDTVTNIAAMRPDFFVIRCGAELDLNHVAKQINIPILNAGWGILGHPTQALLDCVTLIEKWNTLEKKRILFIGDVKHSRVIKSHFELAQILNYDIGVCAPTDFLPETFKNSATEAFTYFNNLAQGLDWADAVITLRVQKERHHKILFDVNNYRLSYGLNSENLSKFKKEGWILHPGPINYGIEMEQHVLADPRSLILDQVQNGVFLREALIRNLLKD